VSRRARWQVTGSVVLAPRCRSGTLTQKRSLVQSSMAHTPSAHTATGPDQEPGRTSIPGDGAAGDHGPQNPWPRRATTAPPRPWCSPQNRSSTATASPRWAGWSDTVSPVSSRGPWAWARCPPPRKRAQPDRPQERRDRRVRGQRGLRRPGAGRGQGTGPAARPNQPERQRHLPRPPGRRLRGQCRRCRRRPVGWWRPGGV
jgi:hypothetical protein